MKHSARWYHLAVVAWLIISRAFGHDVGLSTATIQPRSDGVEVALMFAAKDISLLVELDGNADGQITQGEFIAQRAAIKQAFVAGCNLQCGAARTVPTSIACQLDQTNNVAVQLLFPKPAAGDFDVLFPVIRDLATGHRMFVKRLGPESNSITEQLISGETPVFHVSAVANINTPANEAPRSFAGFLWLGIEHIGTGYDHLLFLFGLLLVARSLKSSLAVITSFTLAHSITLAASTLNLVTLRPAITEPAIAASIVFVGIENLVRRGEPTGRWLLTFAFGLIHGFGFASVLRDMGVGAGSSVVMPLFSFNLGVELGQMTIAAIMLPIIWKLRHCEAFTRRLIPACCLVIAGAGTWWFCERVWGS